MKVIIKHSGGSYQLDQANQHPPTTPGEATSRWGSFGNKATVQNLLLDEQYGLCCYSELRADLEGFGYHIEHIRPKSSYPELTFVYTNLAASALSSDNLQIIKQEAFSGHAKLSAYDPDLFISCRDADCARYFVYLSDGRVVANDSLSNREKDRANYTINLLNLNSPYLVNRRRRWHDELDQLFEEHLEKSWSLEHLVAMDLVPSNRQISQFFSLTRQFFGQFAETVLQQHAPQLL
jgi:uncharacterized protein (TIGR02646 family)